jgi:heme exporter protein CcmD
VSAHGAYILAAYAVTAVVVGGLTLTILLQHRALRRALDALPRRDAADATDDPS